jgi:hypothetical protein
MTALREGQRQSSPPQAPQITALQAGFLREPEVQLVRGGTAFSLLEFGLLPSRGKHPAQTRFPQAASLRPLVNSPKGLLVWPGFQLARGGTCYQPARIRSAPKPGKTSRPNPVSAGCKPAATGQLARGPQGNRLEPGGQPHRKATCRDESGDPSFSRETACRPAGRALPPR